MLYTSSIRLYQILVQVEWHFIYYNQLVHIVKEHVTQSYPSIPLTAFTTNVVLLDREMVEPSGIEPLTSCVQGRRSPS